jgi:hypothetical protein
MKVIASTAKQNVENRVGQRRFGPTCRSVASPKVGPGATVGTLQTEYPYIQTSSQDKLQGVHPHTAMFPTAPDLASQLRWAPVLPRVIWLQISPLG